MYQVFAFTLGFQVTPPDFVDVGVKRAHVQQAADAGFAHGLDDGPRQVDVSATEGAGAFLIEEADEVDDAIAVGEQGRQFIGVVRIDLCQLHPGADAILPVSLRATGDDGDPVTEIGESVGEVRTDKAGAANYNDPLCVHGALFNRAEAIACG